MASPHEVPARVKIAIVVVVLLAIGLTVLLRSLPKAERPTLQVPISTTTVTAP